MVLFTRLMMTAMLFGPLFANAGRSRPPAPKLCDFNFEEIKFKPRAELFNPLMNDVLNEIAALANDPAATTYLDSHGKPQPIFEFRSAWIKKRFERLAGEALDPKKITEEHMSESNDIDTAASKHLRAAVLDYFMMTALI